MENVNDNYFDGEYKELWRSIIPDELTIKETDFIVSYFELLPNKKVLDLMCGYGRHSIALARQGIEVTAVDNLQDYILEVRSIAEKENLPLIASQADVKSYKRSNAYFDLALNMGNSFSFFSPKEAQEFLINLNFQLKSGGFLFLNSWSIAEISIPQFQEKTWSLINNKKYIIESHYLFHPTRIEFEHLILSQNGQQEIKKGIDYIYSISEMEEMLNVAGLQIVEIFSIPGKKKFKIGEPRAYFIARKL